MVLYSMNMNSMIGPLSVIANEDAVIEIKFWSQLIEQPNHITALAIDQLSEYFTSTRKHFTVPIQPSGTNFQHLVWEQLQSIPWGHTKSYGEVAQQIGKKGASRAVGNANNKNPIPIIIPCHRVVGATGKLTGYAGGLGIKSQLLSMESSIIPLDLGD